MKRARVMALLMMTTRRLPKQHSNPLLIIRNKSLKYKKMIIGAATLNQMGHLQVCRELSPIKVKGLQRPTAPPRYASLMLVAYLTRGRKRSSLRVANPIRKGCFGQVSLISWFPMLLRTIMPNLIKLRNWLL